MRFLAVFLALGLAGCATAAQREAVSLNTRAGDANAAFQGCLAGALSSPSALSLAAKMPVQGVSAPSLAQLADTSFVTSDEVAQISALHELVQPCRATYVGTYSGIAPGIANALAESFEAADHRVVDLIQKKMTWGEYNKEAQEAGVRLRVALTAEADKVKAGLDQANAQEMQQRQQAAQAYLNYMQNQAAINAANRPVTTNCTRFGMQVSCTTN